MRLRATAEQQQMTAGAAGATRGEAARHTIAHRSETRAGQVAQEEEGGHRAVLVGSSSSSSSSNSSHGQVPAPGEMLNLAKSSRGDGTPLLEPTAAVTRTRTEAGGMANSTASIERVGSQTSSTAPKPHSSEKVLATFSSV